MAGYLKRICCNAFPQWWVGNGRCGSPPLGHYSYICFKFTLINVSVFHHNEYLKKMLQVRALRTHSGEVTIGQTECFDLQYKCRFEHSTDTDSDESYNGHIMRAAALGTKKIRGGSGFPLWHQSSFTTIHLLHCSTETFKISANLR